MKLVCILLSPFPKQSPLAPTAYSFPLESSLNARPPATAIDTIPPFSVDLNGTKYSSPVPSPRCPQQLLPQDQILPSVSIARVELSSLAATVNFLSGNTCTGDNCSSVVPSARFPFAFAPHAHSPPSTSTAKRCLLTLTKRRSIGICFGTRHSLRVPSPSCPP